MRKSLAESKDRTTRGRAYLALGKLLAAKAEFRRDPWYDRPDRTPFQAYLAIRQDRRIVDHVRTSDPSRTRAEAVAAFRRSIGEFGDVEYAPRAKGGFATIGEYAQPKLNELLHLQIGMVGPEIDGTDVDGKPLKLSDYRGKVVVLSFWGTW